MASIHCAALRQALRQAQEAPQDAAQEATQDEEFHKLSASPFMAGLAEKLEQFH